MLGDYLKLHVTVTPPKKIIELAGGLALGDEHLHERNSWTPHEIVLKTHTVRSPLLGCIQSSC